MKATVWNDAVQMFVILFCFIIILIIGSNDVGGFGYAIRNADAGGRLTIFKKETSVLITDTFKYKVKCITYFKIILGKYMMANYQKTICEPDTMKQWSHKL